MLFIILGIVAAVLVPLLDLVIRKELAPTLDALDGALRQRIAAKPAIMYRLRNHLYSDYIFAVRQIRKEFNNQITDNSS